MNKSKRILITGGAGFIGGALIRKCIKDKNFEIFNLDKISYSSDLSFINNLENKKRFNHFKIDLKNADDTSKAIEEIKPDYLIHLAAESHVDRSINTPKDFIDSNIIGTFNLLEGTRKYLHKLGNDHKSRFRFLHVSTDEVFGSLGTDGKFDEFTRYDPRSPYSASKASSDHLVRSWFHTYNLPTIISNCSNNYGPYQFPEKLIPLTILKAINREKIPVYGNGSNIRDWLYVEDHIEALFLILLKGKIGSTYCIGGNNEMSNLDIVKNICKYLDQYLSRNDSHKLISFVKDRPGHDYRYSINSKKISSQLGWKAKYDINDGIKKTVEWYLENLDWANDILSKSGYGGERIGLI